MQSLTHPERWGDFHESLVESLTLQMEGYQEMWEVFEDSNMDHVLEGQGMVNQGMKILEQRLKERVIF